MGNSNLQLEIVASSVGRRLSLLSGKNSGAEEFMRVPPTRCGFKHTCNPTSIAYRLLRKTILSRLLRKTILSSLHICRILCPRERELSGLPKVRKDIAVVAVFRCLPLTTRSQPSARTFSAHKTRSTLGVCSVRAVFLCGERTPTAEQVVGMRGARRLL